MRHNEPEEIQELERLLAKLGSEAHTRVLCSADIGGRHIPVHAIALGNPSPEAPAVGYFGGVHGLERIGAAVVLTFLRNLLQRLPWDVLLSRQLENMRMLFVPVVNPGGMWLRRRSNPNGVDLMRNAPIDAKEKVGFLIGGHRLGPRLPWFRGHASEPMQAESEALCKVVEEELLSHTFSMTVDCHSGFGVRDRIWFPFAHTRQPIAHLAEMHAFSEILDLANPYHRYVFEPQSRQYLAHGDLWDHLYQLACRNPERIHLPLTLEMGSWRWVKKNPLQVLNLLGLFNPLITHRQERVLRRHVAWLDFVGRAVLGHDKWAPIGIERERHRALAMQRWYAETRS